jgi:hypothetical protein
MCKMVGIFWFGFIFQWKMWWTRFMAHEPVEALAHGGLRIEEVAVSHWSSCSRTVWATMTHHVVGEMKTSSPGFGSDLHRGLDSNEEVVQRRWSLGSER